ncbi:hypothetical protein CATMIT_01780, partial [Catenibacterium mitsuokai DSM 15897]
QQRRTGELDRGEHHAEDAHPPRRVRHAAAGELFEQVRQHRDDHAERQHVDQDGEENEDQPGFALRWRAHWEVHSLASTTGAEP